LSYSPIVTESPVPVSQRSPPLNPW